MRHAQIKQPVIFPYPALRPHMMLPLKRRHARPFPFDSPFAGYYYLARNAIYALARLWNLGDREILVPSYFHGVEIDALLAAGVRLRFYPVHAGMRVDPDEISALISPQVRAVYLIHYLGFPGPVCEVSRICRHRGIRLIEDCALALFSRLGDQPLGSYGDAAIFCLYKTLPLPNGGMLSLACAQEAHLPETVPAPFFSTMAHTALAIGRSLGFDGANTASALFARARAGAKSLGAVPVGNQFFDRSRADLAMSRLCHRIVAAQDSVAIVLRRRRNYQHLRDRLCKLVSPVFPALPEGVCPLFFPVQTQNKVRIIKRLSEHGIEAVNFWSRQPGIIPAGAFPEVEELRNTVLELPCHQDLEPEAVDRIADEVFCLRDEL